MSWTILNAGNAKFVFYRILSPRMVPTVCVAEFPVTGTTVTLRACRRRRRSENDTKRRRFALEEMLRTGTIVETLLSPRENCSRRLDYAVPDCSVADGSGEYPTSADDDYGGRLVAERRKGRKKIAKLRDVIFYFRIILDGYFRISSNPRDLVARRVVIHAITHISDSNHQRERFPLWKSLESYRTWQSFSQIRLRELNWETNS